MRPAVQVWIHTDDRKNVTKIAEALEKAMQASAKKDLRAFLIFIKPNSVSTEALTKEWGDIAAEKKMERVAFTYVPGPEDPAVRAYGINTDAKVKNTIFVYKEKRVEEKFVNLVADEEGLKKLDAAIQNVLR
jgi:hypothetical protein